jgi:hypothetical protein
MKDVNKYLEVLIEYAKLKLKQQFKVESLDFDNLGLVNSYLIYQSIKDKKQNKNTLIYFPNKETKSEFYVPVIITLSLYSFIDNYILSKDLSYSDNTLYRNFFSYQFDLEKGLMPTTFKTKFIIVTEKQFEENLKNFTSSLFYLSISKLKKLIHSSNDILNKLKPIEFKIFCNEEDFFNSIIDLIGNQDTNHFRHELEQSTENNIHKAFPFQYITKTGNKTDNIPTDPMIYIVNDYETARKYILDKGITIHNITFIGENKYKENYLEISEDLNNKRVENCLFIGSSDFPENAIPNLLKWKWTLPELDYFNYFTTFPINKITVEDLPFTEALIEFDTLVSKAENDYGINLKELYKFVRSLMPIIIPSQNSRLNSQLQNSLMYFEKEGKDIVETELDKIGEYDYEDVWFKILEHFRTLIECKKNSSHKFKKINEFEKIDYLVVPKEYIEIWKNEIRNHKIKNIISFKDYEDLIQLYVKNKRIVFLGFFGYNHLKSMIYSSNKISILLYPQEEAYFENCSNRLKNETYNELRNSQRKNISEISFEETEQIENVAELIKRLFGQDEESKLDPDDSESYNSNICRVLTFENITESLELDENKTVLLKTNNQERFEKVKNLAVGDIIRVYDNSSKEELYQVALNFDTEGKFSKIEDYSKLWKNELKIYYSKFNSLTELHQSLINIGLSIKNESTLNNWINPNSNVKFPQRTKDLYVLRKAINSNVLLENYTNILKYRIGYNRIMISLGRKFSTDITEYIRTKKKGEFLQQFSENQIKQFVDQNAKERKIKTIKAIDNEQ